MNVDRTTTLAGFLGALVVLGFLVAVIGVDNVLGALAQADLRLVPVLVALAAIWLFAWGMTLHTVLTAIGEPIPVPKAVFVFSAAVFSNNVTPFGQAGGEPLSALLISSAAETEYETGLAAIASVDTMHFVPSVSLSIVGFTFVLAGAAELTRNLIVAALAVGILVVAIPTAAYLGWRYRYEVEALVVRALTPVIRFLGTHLPGVSRPSPHIIERRIEGFFTAIDRVAGDRRSLVVGMAFSALGWVTLSTGLWVSVYALGFVVPFPAVLFVIPVGSIAGVTPLPGGLGGVEVAFATLLWSVTGLTLPVCTAAVLIYRGATFWLPTVFGGGAAAIVGADSRR